MPRQASSRLTMVVVLSVLAAPRAGRAQVLANPIAAEGSGSSENYDLAFSPDGKRLTAAGLQVLWDTSTGLQMPHPSVGGKRAVAFVADGRHVVRAGERGVQVRHRLDGKPIKAMAGRVDGMSISADGKLLVICSGGEIRLWRTSSWQLVRTLRPPRGWALTSIAVSPNGKYVAAGQPPGDPYPAGYKAQIAIWDAETGTQHTQLDGFASSLAFSPDGHQLGVLSADIRLYDRRTGKLVRTLATPRFRPTCFAISPADRLLAAGGFDGSICLWRADTGRLVERVKTHREPIRVVAFSPRGRRFAAADMPGATRIWTVHPTAAPRAPTPPAAVKATRPSWGAQGHSVRLRLTAPAGNEYRRGSPTPLLVEFKSVQRSPLPLASLPRIAWMEVTDSTSPWPLISQPIIAVPPWEGRPEDLVRGHILQWQIPFGRLRLSKTLPAATTLSIRFALAPPKPIRRTCYSNPVLIKLTADLPSPPTARDVPERWTPQTDLTYREDAGLGPAGPFAIRLDGQRLATLVGPSFPGRTEIVLPRRRLDELAGRLRAMKIWQVSTLEPDAHRPREAGVGLSVAWGGTSLVGRFSGTLVRRTPALAALQNQMRQLVAEVVSRGWGKPIDDVQCALQAELVALPVKEVPVFRAVLRHAGPGRLRLADPRRDGCRLEVDGQWYRWHGPAQAEEVWPCPSDRRGPFRFKLGSNWRPLDGEKPLQVAPGKHTLRFSWTAHRANGDDAKTPVRLVSNALPIDFCPHIVAQAAAENRRRVESLKKNAARFSLLLRYIGPGRPYPTLELTTLPMLPRPYPPGWIFVSIDAKQAVRIIDHLDKQGYLAERDPGPPPQGPAYMLSGPMPPVSLGWGVKMLRHLYALREVLTGPAAKGMDHLLKQLEPQRKLWVQQARQGQPASGLQCRLAAPPGKVRVGDKVVFQLGFQFDPKGVDPKINVLNRHINARRVTLTFREVDTGVILVRHPDDGMSGMPPLRPTEKDFPLLRGRGLAAEELPVRLLSDKGQHVQPGRYKVTATYTNEGKPPAPTAPHGGRWQFWRGTIVSSPVDLVVSGAAPREVELKVNSSLVVRRKEGRVVWSWSQDAPTKVRVKRRPGYFIGSRYDFHVFLDGKEVKYGGGGMGGVWQDGGGLSYLPERIAKRVAAGEALKLRADVEVFETAVPPQHMWAPQSGGYQVLWKGAVTGALPAGPNAKPRNPLTVTIEPFDATVVPGMAVRLRVRFHNVSDRPVKMLAGFMELVDNQILKIICRDGDRPCPVHGRTENAWMWGIGPHARLVRMFPAGENRGVDVTLFEGPRRFRPVQTGTLTLRVALEIDLKRFFPKSPPAWYADGWTGRIDSNAVTVTVAAESAAVTKRITDLVAVLRAEHKDGGRAQMAAVRELIAIGPCARPPMLRLLASPSYTDRSWAIDYFCHPGLLDAEAKTLLLRLAAGARPAELRRKAMNALALHGSTGAAGVLSAALKDKSHDVRASAAESLGQMHVAAAEAIGALEKATKDPHEQVRRAATKALRNIDMAAKIVSGPPAGGLQVGLHCNGVTPGREPKATLLFLMRNAGGKPIRILRLSAQKRFWGENLPVEVTVGGQSRPYRGPVLEPPPPPARAEYIDLAPGAIDVVEATMRLKHWGLDTTTRARIQFVLKRTTAIDIAAPYDAKTKSWTKVTGLWTGVARSCTVTLVSGGQGSARHRPKCAPGSNIFTNRLSNPPVSAEEVGGRDVYGPSRGVLAAVSHARARGARLHPLADP